MSVETFLQENYMLVHEAYTILKLLGFITVIIGIVVYVKISINNLKEDIREEVNERLESLNIKQD